MSEGGTGRTRTVVACGGTTVWEEAADPCVVCGKPLVDDHYACEAAAAEQGICFTCGKKVDSQNDGHVPGCWSSDEDWDDPDFWGPLLEISRSVGKARVTRAQVFPPVLSKGRK